MPAADLLNLNLHFSEISPGDLCAYFFEEHCPRGRKESVECCGIFYSSLSPNILRDWRKIIEVQPLGFTDDEMPG